MPTFSLTDLESLAVVLALETMLQFNPKHDDRTMLRRALRKLRGPEPAKPQTLVEVFAAEEQAPDGLQPRRLAPLRPRPSAKLRLPAKRHG